MADRLKKAAVWLGLMSDGSYDDPDAELTQDYARTQPRDAQSRGQQPRERWSQSSGQIEGEASVTTLDSRRAAPPEPIAPTASAPAPRIADLTRIHTLHPRTYNEARTIGENFRDGVPVIMNLSDMEDADAKRLVDFSAGLTFGLRGTIERITSKVFLLSPQNVNVAAEDKERIAGGFFNQS